MQEVKMGMEKEIGQTESEQTKRLGVVLSLIWYYLA